MFHYSSFLILIAMVSWKKLEGTQFPQLQSTDCCAEMHTGLAHNSHVERQQITNAVFSSYYRQIYNAIKETSKLEKDITDEYNLTAKFKMDQHSIYVMAQRDPEKNWGMGHYKMTMDDVTVNSQE